MRNLTAVVVLHLPVEMPDEGSPALREGWNADTHEQAMATEAGFMRGENGQGDYLISYLDGAGSVVHSITFEDA